MIAAQTHWRNAPPTCHCEAPKGPWQSRRTRLDNRSLPAKTQPVAGDSHVASLLGMTNLGALHVHRECLHICNCQWRSLSAATDAIGLCVFIDALCELQVPSRDCHVGLRPPRNDNSGVGAILTVAGTGCERCAGSGMPLPYRAGTVGGVPPNLQPARRSLSAATDAIGAHHFIDTRYESQALRRERHAAPLQGLY